MAQDGYIPSVIGSSRMAGKPGGTASEIRPDMGRIFLFVFPRFSFILA
jgi:hypothetical protein